MQRRYLVRLSAADMDRIMQIESTALEGCIRSQPIAEYQRTFGELSCRRRRRKGAQGTLVAALRGDGRNWSPSRSTPKPAQGVASTLLKSTLRRVRLRPRVKFRSWYGGQSWRGPRFTNASDFTKSGASANSYEDGEGRFSCSCAFLSLPEEIRAAYPARDVNPHARA